MKTYTSISVLDKSNTGFLNVLAVVTAALTNHSWGLWIGYREYQGKWLWADNSDPNSFTNWAPNPGSYVSNTETECSGQRSDKRTRVLSLSKISEHFSNPFASYRFHSFKDSKFSMPNEIGTVVLTHFQNFENINLFDEAQ